MVELELRADDRPEFRVSELCAFQTQDGETYSAVGHNLELALITDFWFGSFKSSDNFRMVVEFLREQFRRNRYRCWLTDFRFLTRSFAEDGEWLVREVMPKISACGLDRHAIVFADVAGLPARHDVSTSTRAMIDHLGDPRVRGFTDMVEAKGWLLYR